MSALPASRNDLTQRTASLNGAEEDPLAVNQMIRTNNAVIDQLSALANSNLSAQQTMQEDLEKTRAKTDAVLAKIHRISDENKRLVKIIGCLFVLAVLMIVVIKVVR